MPKILKMLIEYDAEQSSKLLEHYIKEENGVKNVYIRGPWTESDIENRNKRVYPHEYLKREMDKINEKAHSGVHTGSCDHPPTPDYNLSDAAIQILNIEQNKKNEKQFMGEAMVIKDSEKGQTLYALCKLGLKPGISSRAVGDTEERDGSTYVGESLNMITFDTVSDPSYQKAFQGVFFEDVPYFVDEKTGYIKEATQSMLLKEKIAKAPKNALPETIMEVYHEFMATVFSPTAKKTEKLFKVGDMLAVKEDIAGMKKGDIYEIAKVPSNISVPYLIKKWGKSIEQTISHKDLTEAFVRFEYDPKKEKQVKIDTEKKAVIDDVTAVLTENEIEFGSVEYLGEKKAVVKTGKKETFAQKKAIAKMKENLKKAVVKAKAAGKDVKAAEKQLMKAKRTIKEAFINGEYVAIIETKENAPVEMLKEEVKKEETKKEEKQPVENPDLKKKLR